MSSRSRTACTTCSCPPSRSARMPTPRSTPGWPNKTDQKWSRYCLGMFAAERRQVILELVRSNGAVSLRELARIVKTSEVTVRRDLRRLEAEGMLARRHGGAVANDRTAYEPSYTEKAGVAAD